MDATPALDDRMGESRPRFQAVVWAENAPWPAQRLLIERVAKLAAVAAGVTAIIAAHVPVCPFALATGVPCPGCGLTRATLAFCRGDVSGAAHLHPGVFLATPAAAVLTALGMYSYLKVGKVRYSPALMRWLLRPLQVIYVALLVVWTVRFLGYLGGPVHVESLPAYVHSLAR